MPMLPAAFNSSEHSDMGSFDPLPAGMYNTKIVEAEMKFTKKAEEAREAGDPNWENIGQRLSIKFEVLDGEYAGRSFYTGLNLVNQNPKAVEISQKEFATLCRALGQVTVTRTEELLEKPVRVKLGLRGKETDQFGIQNEVKGYESMAGGAAPAAAPAAAAAGGAKGRNW